TRVRRLGVFLALCSTASGCYVYQEIDPGSLTAGHVVRLHLSAQPARADVTGLNLNRSVEVSGRVVEWDDARIVMVQDRTGIESGYAFGSTSDTVRASWSAVASMERSRISPVRTVAVVAGGAILAALGIQYFFGDWAGGRAIPRTEGPETFRPVGP